MGISEVLYTAVFCFSMVFALLGFLFVLIKLSTKAIQLIETNKEK